LHILERQAVDDGHGQNGASQSRRIDANKPLAHDLVGQRLIPMHHRRQSERGPRPLPFQSMQWKKQLAPTGQRRHRDLLVARVHAHMTLSLVRSLGWSASLDQSEVSLNSRSLSMLART